MGIYISEWHPFAGVQMLFFKSLGISVFERANRATTWVAEPSTKYWAFPCGVYRRLVLVVLVSIRAHALVWVFFSNEVKPSNSPNDDYMI